jgi:hypothetical protein
MQVENAILRLIKYADDMALVGRLKDEASLAQYNTQVQVLCDWFRESFLELNVGKTKELIVDLRKGVVDAPQKLMIGNEEIEIVTSFKYLGTVVDEKLNFSEHVGTVHKKAQQRLYLLRKLRSFNVSTHILGSVYRALVESIVAFNVVSWCGQASLTNKTKLGRTISTASKIVGSKQLSLADLYEVALFRKAKQVMRDPSHPLNSCFETMPSGRRLRAPLAKKNIYKKSFVPSAVTTLNRRLRH